MSEASLLTGRSALITGGGRRIGRAVALRLAQAGANVAITYRSSEAEAMGTVKDIGALGVQAMAVHCDLGEEDSVRAAVAETTAAFGPLDLLVNNAGAFETAPLESITLAQWDAMFAANTRGPFLMAKTAYPHLKAARGRIVNIGSLGGMHAWSTHGHYCASKASLHMLSQTMAKAWAPDVCVNCVAPGMIVFGDVGAAYVAYAEKTPMRRNGMAEDVAAAVLFFATCPDFITGQLLAVDGGLGL